MLTITIQIPDPHLDPQSEKEALAMYLEERYGTGIRVVSVVETETMIQEVLWKRKYSM